MAVRTKKLTLKQKRKKNIRLVVKANQLVEAKYMFDIWEMRVFLSLVALISSSDEDEKVYRIWYRDVKSNFQLKTNQSYDFLRKAVIRLFDKSLVIGYMKDGYEREQRYHLIKGVDYLKEGQELKKNITSQEYIDVRIDSDIRPFLLDIRKRFDPSRDRYTSYELRNIIELQIYGIRIYELLKQFEGVGRRIIKVQALKDAFNITDEYPRFSNFYQKVIQRSIKDINAKTDITIPLDRIEKIKKGRKIDALRFLILSKNKGELSALRGEPVQETLFDYAEETEAIKPTDSSEFLELYELVKDWFDKSSFKSLIKNTSEEQVKKAVSYTLNRIKKGSIIKNVAGHIVSMSKQPSLVDPVDDQKQKEERRKEKKKQQEAKKLTLEEEKKRIQSELYEKERAIIEAIFLEMPEKEVEILDLTKQNKFAFYKPELSFEENLQSPMFKSAFRSTVKKLFPERFASIQERYSLKLQSIQVKLQDI